MHLCLSPITSRICDVNCRHDTLFCLYVSDNSPDLIDVDWMCWKIRVPSRVLQDANVTMRGSGNCVGDRIVWPATSATQPVSVVLAHQTLFHRVAEYATTASEVTHWGWQPNIYL
jgi:hypothetical protein